MNTSVQIQCECGQFRAELKDFPKRTPGRLACYCDDCQTYLHYLGRQDLLDAGGGTEVIPVYPADMKIVSGLNVLKCTRLGPNGMFRWSTTCCNTPIGNIRPKFPWVGLIHRVYNVQDRKFLEKILGPVKSAISAKYARGTPMEIASEKLTLKDFWTVFPFLFKGFLAKKFMPSPFFQSDRVTPIVAPKILTLEERNSIREKLGFAKA